MMKYWYEECTNAEFWNIYTSDESGFDYDVVAVTYSEHFAKIIVHLLSKYGEI